ncbi:TrbC/VirB2 family protein [Acinetobacter soli]|uniref:TrbC/VirB2 family protein n=1 Tax=Acinetobacter soli TaxID=487316 RepID=UPI00125D7A6A|nr:TrbC/VirB2 family protein [Acinetobacter soli]
MIANPQLSFAQTQNNVKKIATFTLMAIAIVALILMPDFAHAAGTGGGGMPWESPLQKLIDSLTGPVAIGISILCILGAGLALAFGGEITGFVRTMIVIVLVVAVIVFAAGFLTQLTGKSALLPGIM